MQERGETRSPAPCCILCLCNYSRAWVECSLTFFYSLRTPGKLEQKHALLLTPQPPDGPGQMRLCLLVSAALSLCDRSCYIWPLFYSRNALKILHSNGFEVCLVETWCLFPVSLLHSFVWRLGRNTANVSVAVFVCSSNCLYPYSDTNEMRGPLNNLVHLLCPKSFISGL